MEEATHNDTGDAVLRVAVSLQLIRHGSEDAGGQSHVKDSVLLLLTPLDALKVLSEVDEGVILVVLTRDVGAQFAEAVQLLFDFLGGGLDIRSHTSQVFFVVHVCPGIADNLNSLGEELVTVLRCRVSTG
jgi:hypothetical protein